MDTDSMVNKKKKSAKKKGGFFNPHLVIINL